MKDVQEENHISSIPRKNFKNAEERVDTKRCRFDPKDDKEKEIQHRPAKDVRPNFKTDSEEQKISEKFTKKWEKRKNTDWQPLYFGWHPTSLMKGAILAVFRTKWAYCGTELKAQKS